MKGSLFRLPGTGLQVWVETVSEVGVILQQSDSSTSRPARPIAH